jgi:hypothetical protein
MKKRSKVKPIREIDLNKVSVYGLIQMLDEGEHFDKKNDAYWMWMSLQAATQRGWAKWSMK